MQIILDLESPELLIIAQLIGGCLIPSFANRFDPGSVATIKKALYPLLDAMDDADRSVFWESLRKMGAVMKEDQGTMAIFNIAIDTLQQNFKSRP